MSVNVQDYKHLLKKKSWRKKKLNGLLLNKNVITKLNGASINGGGVVTYDCGLGTRICNTNSANLDCYTLDCPVQSNPCELTQASCDSIHVQCF